MKQNNKIKNTIVCQLFIYLSFINTQNDKRKIFIKYKKNIMDPSVTILYLKEGREGSYVRKGWVFGYVGMVEGYIILSAMEGAYKNCDRRGWHWHSICSKCCIAKQKKKEKKKKIIIHKIGGCTEQWGSYFIYKRRFEKSPRVHTNEKRTLYHNLFSSSIYYV